MVFQAQVDLQGGDMKMTGVDIDKNPPPEQVEKRLWNRTRQIP